MKEKIFKKFSLTGESVPLILQTKEQLRVYMKCLQTDFYTCTSWLTIISQHGFREKLWATWTRTGCSQYRRSIKKHIHCSVQFISLLVDAWEFDRWYPYCWFSGATNLTSIYIPNCLQRKHRQNRKNRPTLKVQEATMVMYRQIYIIYLWFYLVNVHNIWLPTYVGIFRGQYTVKVAK